MAYSLEDQVIELTKESHQIIKEIENYGVLIQEIHSISNIKRYHREQIKKYQNEMQQKLVKLVETEKKTKLLNELIHEESEEILEKSKYTK